MRPTAAYSRGSRTGISICRAMLLTLACCVPAQAVVLRTAAQAGTEPKFIAGDGGAIVGLCIDILRAIERVDPQLRFAGDQRWMPLIRAYSEVESGLQDAACAVQRSPERERKMNFLATPLVAVNYHFLARMADPVSIRNWNDVRKLAPDGVVLANRGFAAAAILAQQGGIETDASSTSPALNLQKLVAGRGRLYFHRSPGLKKMLEHNGMGDKVRILPTVMYRASLYMVTGPHVARGVVERLEQALAQLEVSGELERLARKWD